MATLCAALLGASSLGADENVAPAAHDLDSRARRSFERRLVDAPDGVFAPSAWKRIARAIGDARVLYLGEPNHGSREIFVTRNAFIREMHQRLGFDVILLEAGIGEVAAARKTADTRTADSVSALNAAMFGGWRSSEMRELFTHAVQNDIAVAGFDIQRTGNGFAALFEGFLRAGDSPHHRAHEVEAEYTRLARALRDRKKPIDPVIGDIEHLIEEYIELARGAAVQLARSSTTREDPASVVVTTLLNRADYLEYMLEFRLEGDWNKRWAARDRRMARNVAWLASHIYPDRKIIVIGHNFHVARHNEREEVMGEYLEELLERPSYVLGAFSGRGEFADNSGRPEPLSPPDPERLDIKHVILGMRAPLGFLDFPRQTRRCFGWLDRDIAVHDTFIDLSRGDSMKLRQHFDGLLLIKDSSLPQR